MAHDNDRVTMVEVSPRDGLQNEKTHVATDAKLTLINKLVAAGLSTVEITSCVSPRWVPQLADHARLIADTRGMEGIRLPVLVPNAQGFETAIAAGAGMVSVIASASQMFSQKNSNCSIEDGLHRCDQILGKARELGIGVRGYVSCTLGCPYEGAVRLSSVIEVVERLYGLGCTEIALSDTIGVGTPRQVRELIRGVAGSVPASFLAVHFHDTYGQALANILAALEYGIRIIDSSVAGLGGCPYASGASGNVASEDLLYMLDGLGMNTGVDLDKLVEAGAYICSVLGRESGSRVARALSGGSGTAVE